MDTRMRVCPTAIVLMVAVALGGALAARRAPFGCAAVFAASADSADRTKMAQRALAEALNQKDAAGVESQVKLLVGEGGKANVSILLSLLPKVREERFYWMLVEGACSFTDAEALEYLGETISYNSGRPISRDLIYGISQNRSKHTLLALGPLLKKGPRDLQILAVRKIAKISVPDSVDLLIDFLKQEEAKVKDPQNSETIWEIADALTELTGQTFGPLSVNWEGWWKENRDARLGRRRKSDEGQSGTVVDSLRRTRKEAFYGLENAPKEAVVVLSAEYGDPINRDLNNDHIEEILQRMRVPHTVVKRERFLDYDLRKAGVLIINCSQFHEFCACPDCQANTFGRDLGAKRNRLVSCPGCDKHDPKAHPLDSVFSAKLSGDAIEKVSRFVKRGGYLFGEDWVVKEVLEKAFPKYVKTGVVLRRHEVPSVDVVPARGRVTHPYLRGIFLPVKAAQTRDDQKKKGRTVVAEPTKKGGLVSVKHRWSVDDESWAFELVNDKKTLVLMVSGELEEKAHGQGVVAFAFRPGAPPSTIGKALLESTERGSRRTRRRGSHGAGVVLQVLSHFGKQRSERDEHLLQNLLLNFLIDANVERQKRLGPDR